MVAGAAGGDNYDRSLHHSQEKKKYGIRNHYTTTAGWLIFATPNTLKSNTVAWPSGLRRQLQALVRKGAGSNPAAITFSPRLSIEVADQNQKYITTDPTETKVPGAANVKEADEFLSGPGGVTVLGGQDMFKEAYNPADDELRRGKAPGAKLPAMGGGKPPPPGGKAGGGGRAKPPGAARAHIPPPLHVLNKQKFPQPRAEKRGPGGGGGSGGPQKSAAASSSRGGDSSRGKEKSYSSGQHHVGAFAAMSPESSAVDSEQDMYSSNKARQQGQPGVVNGYVAGISFEGQHALSLSSSSGTGGDQSRSESESYSSAPVVPRAGFLNNGEFNVPIGLGGAGGASFEHQQPPPAPPFVSDLRAGGAGAGVPDRVSRPVRSARLREKDDAVPFISSKRVPSSRVMDKWQTGNYDPYPMVVKTNNFVQPESGK